MEKELAKRTHFCQKYIKKLKTQIQEMKEKDEVKSQSHDFGRPAVMGISRGHNRKNKSMAGNELASKANEDFVSFLEHKLEEIEKKLQKTQ